MWEAAFTAPCASDLLGWAHGVVTRALNEPLCVDVEVFVSTTESELVIITRWLGSVPSTWEEGEPPSDHLKRSNGWNFRQVLTQD